MTLEEFKTSLSQQNVPEDLSPALKSLWADGAGNWETAHHFVQDDDSAEAAWVHAYLHRKEGDEPNARYWYRRAGQSFYEGKLEDEWAHIAGALLK